MKTPLIVPLAALLLSSCVAVHSGTMTGNVADFTIVGHAYGTAEATYFLGFGGWGKDALVLDAKRNLYENYPLRPGQALANVTVDFRTRFLLIYAQRIVVISADIVDFNPDAQPIGVAEVVGPDPTPRAKARVGDKVVISDGSLGNQKGTVIDTRASTSKVRYLDDQGDFRLTTLNTGSYLPSYVKDTLSGRPRKITYKVGDEVEFSYRDELYTGKIKTITSGSAFVTFTNQKGVSTSRWVPLKRLIPAREKSLEE